MTSKSDAVASSPVFTALVNAASEAKKSPEVGPMPGSATQMMEKRMSFTNMATLKLSPPSTPNFQDSPGLRALSTLSLQMKSPFSLTPFSPPSSAAQFTSSVMQQQQQQQLQQQHGSSAGFDLNGFALPLPRQSLPQRKSGSGRKHSRKDDNAMTAAAAMAAASSSSSSSAAAAAGAAYNPASAPASRSMKKSKANTPKHSNISNNGTMMMKPQKVSRPVSATGETIGGSSCHQCKSRRGTHDLTFCTANLDNKKKHCRKKYCDHCLKKFYQESSTTIVSKSTWACPSCRRICCCAACRRRDLKAAEKAAGGGKTTGGSISQLVHASSHQQAFDASNSAAAAANNSSSSSSGGGKPKKPKKPRKPKKDSGAEKAAAMAAAAAAAAAMTAAPMRRMFDDDMEDEDDYGGFYDGDDDDIDDDGGGGDGGGGGDNAMPLYDVGNPLSAAATTQQQQQQQQQYQQHAQPQDQHNVDAEMSANDNSAFALLYTVAQVPNVKKHIQYILARKDMTDQQKVESIATLLRGSAKDEEVQSQLPATI